MILYIYDNAIFLFNYTKGLMKKEKRFFMIPYKDINRDSGVVEYFYGEDYINVRFQTGSVYTYSYGVAGRENVERMKVLADRGDGLNAFINTSVKFLYDK